MPRARNIKPAFFSNEVLAALPALTRLLFVGLWTLADREGRLEDRPGKIKLQVLPLDDTNVDAALGELADAGFIQRYTVAGQRYIQIVTFTRHQSPHVREAASVIPPPDTDQGNAEPGAEHRQDRLNPDSLIPDVLIADDPLSTATPPFAGEKQASTGARARARPSAEISPRPSRRAIRDALSAACYGRAPPDLTGAERVWLDTAAAELASQPDATAAEIARRVAHYRVIWAHLSPPSPRAVVRNWSTLGAALAADGADETSGRTADDDAIYAALDAALSTDAALPPGAGGPGRPAP